MASDRLKRQFLLGIGVAAVAGMATLAGCSSQGSDTVTPSSGSAAPSAKPSSTEKAVTPSGGNSFSPNVKAKPAPTALPGSNQIGN